MGNEELAISAAEYAARLQTTRQRVADAGLSALLAYGDCWRGANITYFTEFRPLDGVLDLFMGLLALPLDGDPTLFVSEMCVPYAQSVTAFPVKRLAELPATLKALASRVGRGRIGLAGAPYIAGKLLDQIRAELPNTTLEPTEVLAKLKAVKSEQEVRLIRKAAELTDLAMATIQGILADGKPHSERELAHRADAAMLLAGADRTAYDTMVQAGERSAYFLARPTDRVLQPGDLIMTDIGARYRAYVADGGRGFTYGPASQEKRDIMEAAATAVEAGLHAARPGITASDLNSVVQKVLVDRGYEQFSGEARGHGTGHGTGMDPEEELPWIGPGNETPLVENMVFTLKATITVPRVGGLRIERVVRITKTGCEALDQFPMRLHW